MEQQVGEILNKITVLEQECLRFLKQLNNMKKDIMSNYYFSEDELSF